MDNKTMIKVINGMAEDIIKLSIKMDDLKKDWIFKLNDMDKILLNRIDDLTSELNGIYKVLEMDSDDIQDLQEEISLKFGKYNNKMENK